MTLKGILCFVIMCCSMTTKLYGQSESKSKDSINYEELSNKLYGTYQIEMIDTRSLPSFPAELLEVIEVKREENTVVYHNVSEIMRIKILPKSIINAADFKPLKRINYISSKDL